MLAVRGALSTLVGIALPGTRRSNADSGDWLRVTGPGYSGEPAALLMRMAFLAFVRAGTKDLHRAEWTSFGVVAG